MMSPEEWDAFAAQQRNHYTDKPSPSDDNAPASPYSYTERRRATRQRRRDDRSPEVARRMRGEERRMATGWSEPTSD